MKSKIINREDLTKDAYVLSFTKPFEFEAGQYLSVYLNGEVRDYSIFNSVKDNHLEILVKEVGNVSSGLRSLDYGTEINIDGPFGDFTINDSQNKRFLFIATGVGISPFRSLVLSHPTLDYKLIHGVRYLNEAYKEQDFDEHKYTLCTTKDVGDFQGRVTDYLKTVRTDKNSNVYVCGNMDMVQDVYELLSNEGIKNIQSEVFYFDWKTK